MKRLQFLFAVCLAWSVLPAIAEESPEEQWLFHGYASATLQQRYLGLRISRDLWDGWMLWSEVNLDLPKGFFIDLWDSTPLTGHGPAPHGGEEFDVTGGWKTKTVGGVDLTLSATLFNLYPLDRWWDGDTWVQTLTASRTFSLGQHHSLTPQLWIEWLSQTEDYAGGSVVLLPNLTHVWRQPLGIKRLTIVNRSMIAWDDGFVGPHDSPDGIFYRWDAGLQWRVAKHLSLTLPGFTTLVPLTDPHDGRKQGNSLSCSLRLTF